MRSGCRSRAGRKGRGIRAGRPFAIEHVPLHTFRVQTSCPEPWLRSRLCQQRRQGTRRQQEIGPSDLLLGRQEELVGQALL